MTDYELKCEEIMEEYREGCINDAVDAAILICGTLLGLMLIFF